MGKKINTDHIKEVLKSGLSGDELSYLLSIRPDVVRGLIEGRLKIGFAYGPRHFGDLISDCALSLSSSHDRPEPSQNLFPLEQVCGIDDYGHIMFDYMWKVEEYFFAPKEDGLPISKKLSLLKRRVKVMNRKAGYLKYALCGVRRALEYVDDNPQIQVDHPLVVPVLSRGPRKDLVPFFYYLKFEEDGNTIYESRIFEAKCVDEVDREGPSGRAGWLLLRKKPSSVPKEFRKKNA